MRINSKVSNLERERILIGWGLWHQYPRVKKCVTSVLHEHDHRCIWVIVLFRASDHNPTRRAFPSQDCWLIVLKTVSRRCWWLEGLLCL